MRYGMRLVLITVRAFFLFSSDDQGVKSGLGSDSADDTGVDATVGESNADLSML
jgi:hypothetical protein